MHQLHGPGFYPSIRQRSGIWGAADEAVLNIVWKKKSPQYSQTKDDLAGPSYVSLLFCWHDVCPVPSSTERHSSLWTSSPTWTSASRSASVSSVSLSLLPSDQGWVSQSCVLIILCIASGLCLSTAARARQDSWASPAKKLRPLEKKLRPQAAPPAKPSKEV